MTITEYEDRIVELLTSNPTAEVVRAVAVIVREHSEGEPCAELDTVELAAFGPRFECVCGSMVLPGDDTCWGCGERPEPKP